MLWLAAYLLQLLAMGPLTAVNQAEAAVSPWPLIKDRGFWILEGSTVNSKLPNNIFGFFWPICGSFSVQIRDPTIKMLMPFFAPQYANFPIAKAGVTIPRH